MLGAAAGDRAIAASAVTADASNVSTSLATLPAFLWLPSSRQQPTPLDHTKRERQDALPDCAMSPKYQLD